MSRAGPIVALVVLGCASYFSFLAVDASRVADRDKEIADLKNQLTQKDTVVEGLKKSNQERVSQIRDALFIVFPANRQQIEAAFNPPEEEPTTQPTTAPTSQPN